MGKKKKAAKFDIQQPKINPGISQPVLPDFPINWDPVPPWFELVDNDMQKRFAEMEIKFKIKELQLKKEALNIQEEKLNQLSQIM